MWTISQGGSQIPVCREVDVLVIGSGPAGSAAAITAARSGAKTLLVDLMSVPGGISTAGLMSHYTGSVESALYQEVLQRMKENDESPVAGVPKTVIDPTSMTLTWIELLEEAGADLLLYTMACEAVVEDGKIRGVILQNKSGRSAVFAKVVIDATGDGDIAASAGVP